MPKYHRAVFVLEVLSLTPIRADMRFNELGDLMGENGPYAGGHQIAFREELTGKQMADALDRNGFSTEFFDLDADGNLIPDEG